LAEGERAKVCDWVDDEDVRKMIGTSGSEPACPITQREIWDEFSSVYSDCLSTHPDQDLADLELDYILDRVQGKTLNVGCGIGHETWTCQLKTGEAEGLDFSEKMVKVAKRRFPDCTFTLGDVLDLPYPDNSFDTVTTRRTLINLLKAEEQKRAIDEIKRVTKNGGRVILVEATEQGYSMLNGYRKMFGLGEIRVVEFNLPMDEDMLLHEFPGAEVCTLDTYYLLTRLYYPLVSEKVENGTVFQKRAKEMQKQKNIPLRCSPHVLLTATIKKD
jgi:ubiquinone/menaquinone biosynthesis C-methylase UbiE